MNIVALTSDHHHFHHNIIKYCDRPFNNVDEMHEYYIKEYNKVISPNDTVIWAGDVCFSKYGDAKSILDRMNGSKILVRGNHDPSDKECLKLGFSIVVKEMYLKIGKYDCKVNHFPYWNPNGQDKRHQHLRPKKEDGIILLHGHTHSKEKFVNGCIHVGVDAWDRPALLSEIEQLIDENLK